MSKHRRVRVRIPASTSNLGPGYDVLGLALKLYNEIEVTVTPSGPLSIAVEGEGARTLPRDGKNLVWRSMRGILSRSGGLGKGYHIRQVNRIPLARGLGSSAAATLGGMLAANALRGGPFSTEEILESAVRLEGHPDNIVPSLAGGFCVSAVSNGKVRYIRLDPPRGVSAVVCVPAFELSTKKARAVLPGTVSRGDAVHNISRVALLLAALSSRDYSYIRMAMEDRLHQDYRKRLIPGFDRVLRSGYRAGALGIALSGAGPSIFAFAPSSKASAVGRSMAGGFVRSGIKAGSLTVDLSSRGAEVSCR